MSSGLKIVLPTSFTDSSLPVLHDDAILSTGSLLLVDPAHSANPWSAVPANGSTVPNIAWKEAAALLGSGSQASLACSYTSNGASNVVTLERTTKGAFHGIISQVNNTSISQGVLISAPTVIRDYLAANPTHSYYLSTWVQNTRAAIAPNGPGNSTANIYTTVQHEFAAQSGYANNFMVVLSQTGTLPTTGGSTYLGSRATASPNSTGAPIMRNVAASGGGGTFNSTTSANDYAIPAVWGTYAQNGTLLGSGTTNGSPSYVLYRVYLEDLTASGRTYATVDALDYSLYTAALVTSGGRYYGDTWTSPSTVP